MERWGIEILSYQEVGLGKERGQERKVLTTWRSARFFRERRLAEGQTSRARLAVLPDQAVEKAEGNHLIATADTGRQGVRADANEVLIQKQFQVDISLRWDENYFSVADLSTSY